jgi:2-oxoglutarate ferredoxin oxidoreductase subunit gamma
MSRYELRFSGAGGQGLITAGIIMAKAASIYEGKQAVQSQSYGPEARGGASKSEVIISDGPIDYPKVTTVRRAPGHDPGSVQQVLP